MPPVAESTFALMVLLAFLILFFGVALMSLATDLQAKAAALDAKADAVLAAVAALKANQVDPADAAALQAAGASMDSAQAKLSQIA